MAKLTIRYFVNRPNKDGSPRYYWQPDTLLRQKGWAMRRLANNLSEAMAEAEGINEAVDLWRANQIDGPVNEKPGTVDAMIAAYKKSRHFTDLAPRTQKDYSHYLEAVSSWAGDIPAASITAKSVNDLYETQMAKAPRKAMYLIQVLRLLFSFGERTSLIPKGTNPATRPGIKYKAAKGTIWAPEHVQCFVKHADAMGFGSIGTAVMLNEWLGQRKGDIIALTIGAYRDGAIHIRQSKTNANVALPIDMVPALKARLDLQLSRNKEKKTTGTAIIQQRNGRPYSEEGFGSLFERIRLQASKELPALKDLVFKDLRHTAVTRLSEAGAETPMIAAVTGHSFKTCEDIIDRYNIRTTAMAREAFQRRIDLQTNQGGK